MGVNTVLNCLEDSGGAGMQFRGGGHELHHLPVQVDVQEGSFGGLIKKYRRPVPPLPRERAATPPRSGPRTRSGEAVAARSAAGDTIVSSLSASWPSRRHRGECDCQSLIRLSECRAKVEMFMSKSR